MVMFVVTTGTKKEVRKFPFMSKYERRRNPTFLMLKREENYEVGRS